MASVREFEDGDQQAFRDLNLAWIEPLFGIEAEDLNQLGDVRTQILDHGGRAFVAEHEGEVCGTVALIPKSEALVELAKMCVRSDLQGLGIGRLLMDRAVVEARSMGAQRIWIESNSSLDAALALYRKSGFVELPQSDYVATPFCRCDIQLVKEL
ncbi:MAG: GNAT family N-acetyltransferase [Planctomycetota bacterium]